MEKAVNVFEFLYYLARVYQITMIVAVAYLAVMLIVLVYQFIKKK